MVERLAVEVSFALSLHRWALIAHTPGGVVATSHIDRVKSECSSMTH